MVYWLLQNLDTGAEHVFKDKHIALHNAEIMVGNRSAAEVPNMGAENTPGYLYGPGDGTTSVMVRGFTESDILAMGYNLPV